MKQLLLRVPDDVHRRLTARATRAGRSVNSLATEILDAAADSDDDRRSRLRARATALGVLREVPAPPDTITARRAEIIASTKGLGSLADQLLAEERDRV